MTRLDSRFPIFYSPLFLEHDTGLGHPENAGRLTATVDVLRSVPWAEQLQWIAPTPPRQRDPLPWVYQVHNPQYVSALDAFAERGGGNLDADTVVSAQSYEAALLAVSAWLDGVDWVRQRHRPAFVLARPPGHHAERDRGMGFCLLSNAAIAAHYALDQSGIERVAVLDWDVHHGNGTQALTEDSPQIAYCSFHQSPAYPGTGAASETGMHQNVLNLPLPSGSTWADYQPLLTERAVPFLRDFGPNLLIVSAGYDATQADPLASISLQPEHYEIFSRTCLGITSNVLFGLEGGYDYAALSRSVAATIAACLKTSAGERKFSPV